MHIEKHQTMLRQHGTLLARIFVGGLFLFAGIQKLSGGVGGASGVEGMIANIGLPFPLAIAWIVVLIEIVAGAALILGYFFYKAAATLFVFILLTILLVHDSFNDPMLLKNVAIMGGLLYMLAYGPGDGWRIEKRQSTEAGMPPM